MYKILLFLLLVSAVQGCINVPIRHNNSKSYLIEKHLGPSGLTQKCNCKSQICVRKCCDLGYLIKNDKCIISQSVKLEVPVYVNTLPTSRNFDGFHFVPGLMPCKEVRFQLEPQLYPEDTFFIQTNGSLWGPTLGLLSVDHYCVDNFASQGVSVMVCYAVPVEQHVSNSFLYLGMIISIPFLLGTFLVYAILPDRNLHGKALMSYVLTLMFAYILLVFIQLYPADLPDIACILLGLFCYFFFMVSFFWMNVMCIDIWWAFSGVRASSGSRRDADRKRFIFYSFYAWGVPIVVTIVILCLTVNISKENISWYNPGLGDSQCWFRVGYPTLLYFYAPMGLLITLNVVLFVITACKIRQVQRDTAMLRRDDSRRHTYENDNQRFNLYVKLLLAMGINWSMEIISWAVNWQIGKVPKEIWYVTDFCNALYGVVIFVIFVCKANVWRQLQKRYYIFIGRPHLAQTVIQSGVSARTNSSALSHTIVPEKHFGTEDSHLATRVP